MRKTGAIASIACGALAGACAPATADVTVDPQMVCPDMFVPTSVLIAPPGTDKNGNAIVCMKPADGMIVWRDDLLMP
jgi:hypothetical protein